MSGDKRRCNQLDGKAWTRYSISVWSDIRKSAEEMKLNHPASFPLELARRCIEMFTGGTGELVVDPFAGSGTTLIAAYNLGRRGVGFELYPGYVELFKRWFEQEGVLVDCPKPNGESKAGSASYKPEIFLEDARNLGHYFEPGEMDFVLTSPPYWNIMQSRRSADFKLPRPYGEDSRDLGRVDSYRDYLLQLEPIFGQVYRALKPGGYCVSVVMDLRKKSEFYPLHLDLTRCLEQTGFSLDDIIIWDRRSEYNRLRPLGYPAVFRVNKVHEYILIFKKTEK